MNTDQQLTVSVVVATYNRPAELERLLEGLAEQDRAPDEVIVVDDGSTPPAAPKFPDDVEDRWTILHQENAGAATARDTGIRAASGDVILIVDDDMIVTPRLVASHLERHHAGYEVVKARFDEIESDDRPLYNQFVYEQQLAYFAACAASDDAIVPERMSTGNVSFRRDRYFESGGFDTSLRRREDSELGLRLAATGARFGFTNEPTAVHDEPAEPLSRFLTVAYEYGESEQAMYHRHPETYRPWDLVDAMPAPLRLLIGLLDRWPRLMRLTGRLAAGLGVVLERIRLRGPAVRMYGVAFALHWFSGMITKIGRKPTAAPLVGDTPDQRVDIDGVFIDAVEIDEAIDRIVGLARLDRPSIVVTPNVDHLVLCHKVPAFRRTYDRADLVLADGMPIVQLCRLLRLPVRSKVSGSDLVVPLLRASAAAGVKVFILGTTEEIADEAIAKLRDDIPSLEIVGRASPWFNPDDDAAEAAAAFDQIAASGAELVLVAFGSPKEGQLLDRFWETMPPACFLACGASIDFIANRVPRAPAWMSRAGLEWLFRLYKEPKRLWKRYLVQDLRAVPVFARVIWRRISGQQLVTTRTWET